MSGAVNSYEFNGAAVDGVAVVPFRGVYLSAAGPAVNTETFDGGANNGPNAQIQALPAAQDLSVLNTPVATTETGTSLLGEVWPDQGAAEVHPWAATVVVPPC